jgi:D-3-phosphoglycerate dehydrogenase
VGLDVYPDEPTAATAEYHHPLLDLPGVYGTHHIGASTDEAQEAVAAETVRIVRAFIETGRAPNVVNPAP